MTYLRIFAILITLFELSDQSHAFGGPASSSVSSGEIMILPPPDDQRANHWRGESGKMFKSGKWLALVCDVDKCRLVSVTLKVTNNPLPKGEMPEYFIFQTMKWDLSSIRKVENIVIFVMPHAGLVSGAVQTWYAPHPTDSALDGHDRAKIENTVVATALANQPDHKSIIVPMEVANKNCAEAQAANNRCERKTFRVQLREGKTRQWMGPPLTDPCYPIGDFVYLPNNFLQWIGDLDHDQKPDYIIHLSWADGYILMLSSFAKSGQLVGEAGHYKPWSACD